jgi:hypothetical protein
MAGRPKFRKLRFQMIANTPTQCRPTRNIGRAQQRTTPRKFYRVHGSHPHYCKINLQLCLWLAFPDIAKKADYYLDYAPGMRRE